VKNRPEENNPWKTLSTKEIYQNPWISVREDQVLNPAGKPGIYGVVSFKNNAIGIVPIDHECYTYLVGQYRYTLNAYSWEIPEGGGPQGEAMLDTAKRELEEETGFTAKEWIDLGPIHTSNSVTDEYGCLFLAKELSQGAPNPEETEELRIKKVLLSEAIEMVMRGEITDSLSIAGLFKAARYLNSKV
jgi:8-oxo-dGTP pyrophosphatase MutT (NUDIX family)